MKKEGKKNAPALRVLKNLAGTLAGTMIYALGMGFFLVPNNLSAGGVAGIALLVSQVTPGIGTGIWMLLLNIPILVLGLRSFGVRFLGLTMVTLLISSPLVDVFSALGAITAEPLLAALAGGAFLGTGTGILFRFGSSSGGVDIITKLVHSKYKHIKTGMVYILLDVAILVATAFVFDNLDLALYGGISILISGYLMNTVLYGTDEARVVYIVTDDVDSLSTHLLKDLNVGATVMDGYGAYTGKGKKVLMCVMRPKQLPFARDLVAEWDPKAFMIVAGATAVFGVGFKSYTEEDF